MAANLNVSKLIKNQVEIKSQFFFAEVLAVMHTFNERKNRLQVMQYLQGHFSPSPDLKEETYSALINKIRKENEQNTATSRRKGHLIVCYSRFRQL